MLTIPVDKITPGIAIEVGKAIYNDKIKDTLGPEYKGKIVVIDIHSGDYEIGDTDLEANMRLLERRPNAYTWAEKVGYPAVYVMKRAPDFPPAPIQFDDENDDKDGKAIYNDKIKDTLGPEHKGKVVVIDINSGDYEIGDDDMEATQRLLERRPDADAWAKRVGYPALYEIATIFPIDGA